jgi:four helix bundle protein
MSSPNTPSARNPAGLDLGPWIFPGSWRLDPGSFANTAALMSRTRCDKLSDAWGNRWLFILAKEQMKTAKYRIRRGKKVFGTESGGASSFAKLPCECSFAPEENVLKEGSETGPSQHHPFDLLERTAIFGENIIRFSKKIPRDPGNNRLIDQLVGSATSVGANYCEANEGVSKKDFRHPISRSVKEAKETKFFLRMVVASEPQRQKRHALFIAKPMSCC